MKTYLLISPQSWGKMYLSKHNYAIELAEAGNKVYFLNPPYYAPLKVTSEMKVSEIQKNLYLVGYTLPSHIYTFRFKARPLHDLFVNNVLIKQLNKLETFDELWCFEHMIFSSFRNFKAKKKLLFLVDYYDNKILKKLAREADGIATISTQILDYFSFADKPKLLLHHGLNKNYAGPAREKLQNGIELATSLPVKVAYIGNLFQGERFDHVAMQQMIEQNPSVEFHIYGPQGEKGNMLGTVITPRLQAFYDFMKSSPNVFLHGVMEQSRLAREVQKMDVFLTCYNYLTDINKSSNCHKVIEYLSTGKVVVANRLIAYENMDDLVVMPVEMTNENLPSLFQKVIGNLAYYNAPEKQEARIRFALENTYQNHIKTIDRFMQNCSAGAKIASPVLS